MPFEEFRRTVVLKGARCEVKAMAVLRSWTFVLLTSAVVLASAISVCPGLNLTKSNLSLATEKRVDAAAYDSF